MHLYFNILLRFISSVKTNTDAHFNYIFKMARPDRPSIAYIGDGAWGMSLNEVLTCVRENIPAIGVVFNNGQWGAEKKNQVNR